ncbi:M1 family peptidase, partial [Streptomyces sp. 2MCAF27]
AIALQALRNEVGDEDFFAILKGWPTERRYGNGSVRDFEAYAEKVSGRPLGGLFDTWLFTGAKPSAPAARANGIGAGTATDAGAAARPKSWRAIHATDTVHASR